MTELEIKALGYSYPQQGADGTWYALGPFIFTWAIIAGIDEVGYRVRWCYGDLMACANAYEDWRDIGFMGKPEGWIAEK